MGSRPARRSRAEAHVVDPCPDQSRDHGRLSLSVPHAGLSVRAADNHCRSQTSLAPPSTALTCCDGYGLRVETVDHSRLVRVTPVTSVSPALALGAGCGQGSRSPVIFDEGHPARGCGARSRCPSTALSTCNGRPPSDDQVEFIGHRPSRGRMPTGRIVISGPPTSRVRFVC